MCAEKLLVTEVHRKQEEFGTEFDLFVQLYWYFD
ncbi:hypothetical protein N601_19855 [Rhodococcus erythropolis DN1]|nr:hypothetical protein N601_19855 [Rhodococcus erythropolis DN1]